LEAVLRARTKKQGALAHILYPARTLRYRSPSGRKEVIVEGISAEVFDELLTTLPEDIRDNRGPFRLAELLTFGSTLQDVQVEGGEEPEEVPGNGAESEEHSQ
jgi:hypothetical protein